MKVVLIGPTVKEGSVGSFARGFVALGHKVVTVDDRKMYEEVRLTRNRYIHRVFWRFAAIPLQRKLVVRVVAEKPDIVMIIKGSFIKPGTLLAIKKANPSLALYNFNPDSPFNTWHHGASNTWIRRAIPLYDVYFIWGKHLIEPLKQAGARRVEYLPCGYDPALRYPVEMNEDEKEFFGSDVAFIGSWDPEREKQLEPLLNYDFKIWGNSWEKANKKTQTKWQRRKVIGEDFIKVCRASKINMNFGRRQMGPASNIRTFEIPACKGFELSARTEAQKEFFEEGEEMEFFSTPKELMQKIDFYLHHEKLRRQITEAGYRRVVGSDYTYTARVRQILRVYNEQKTDIV